jgi:two-component system copper resistance phosphate regulon response regulator CusR
MQPKRILIAEDEDSLAKILRNNLNKANYITHISQDGAEALAELKQNHYDLVLLDLLMPKTDGWEVLTQLKGKGLKIIVLSNLSQDEDIKKAKELGAVDFWVKSDIPISDIVEKVKLLI